MKRIILSLIVACSATMTMTAADNDTTVCFTVNPPMSCQNCENKIRSNLRFEKGIKQIDASAKDAVVTVKYDKRKTSVDKLIPAFKRIGYEAQPADPKWANAQKPACKSGCCSGKK